MPLAKAPTCTLANTAHLALAYIYSVHARNRPAAILRACVHVVTHVMHKKPGQCAPTQHAPASLPCLHLCMFFMLILQAQGKQAHQNHQQKQDAGCCCHWSCARTIRVHQYCLCCGGYGVGNAASIATNPCIYLWFKAGLATSGSNSDHCILLYQNTTLPMLAAQVISPKPSTLVVWQDAVAGAAQEAACALYTHYTQQHPLQLLT